MQHWEPTFHDLANILCFVFCFSERNWIPSHCLRSGTRASWSSRPRTRPREVSWSRGSEDRRPKLQTLFRMTRFLYYFGGLPHLEIAIFHPVFVGTQTHNRWSRVHCLATRPGYSPKKSDLDFFLKIHITFFYIFTNLKINFIIFLGSSPKIFFNT